MPILSLKIIYMQFVWLEVNQIQLQSMKYPISNHQLYSPILSPRFFSDISRNFFIFLVFYFLYIQSFFLINYNVMVFYKKKSLTSLWRRQCRKWRNRSWQIETETSWRWRHPPILSVYGVVLIKSKSKTVSVQCCSKVKKTINLKLNLFRNHYDKLYGRVKKNPCIF